MVRRESDALGRLSDVTTLFGPRPAGTAGNPSKRCQGGISPTTEGDTNDGETDRLVSV